ncbi:DHA2 family efflux MFS transporter permease subunit [Propionicimonas sp.]|uniref:DHA2 family efflux MFS transporter permease subunit n=1 Tax=Propionicimonas sp. TaxID=1955623 RepID=UPI0039E621A9
MTTAAPAAPAGRKPGAQAVAPGSATHWVGPLLVLIVGMFMTVLDTSIVNVAVPTIQTEFGGSTADIAWIATAYSLVLGVVVPTTAWLGDKVGLGRLYTVSLVGFAIGSALCGFAWNLPSLIAFRVLQAIPGGILPAITMTMLFRIVPKDKFGTAMGLYGVGVIAAPALGPTLGGYLVEFVGWRLIFYINIPVAVAGVVLAVMMLPKFAQQPTYRFDILGFVTVAVGMVCLLLAFSEGASWGWTSYPILGLLITSVLSLALFVLIELEVEHPLLNLNVFRVWPYLNSLLIMSVLSIGMFATLFYVPTFLQSVLGLPALQAGLVVMPQALVMAVMAPLSGRLYDRFGPRWLVVSGLLISAYATYLMTGLSVYTTTTEIIEWTCLRAVGTGLAMMSVQSSGMAALDPRLTSSGTAINNVVQRVSQGLGLAALSALMVSQQAQLTADRYGLISASDPRVTQLGLAALYQLAQSTSLEVVVTSFTNLFQITTWLTVIAAGLGLFLRSGGLTATGPRPTMAD